MSRETFQNISLQLTLGHVRHLGGVPLQGLVEGSGPVKHCEKRSVRENMVCERKHFKTWTPLQLTVLHVSHCPSVPARDVAVEGSLGHSEISHSSTSTGSGVGTSGARTVGD